MPLRIPKAITISKMGIRRITPLANRKHTINAGRAITIRMDAIIFVAPQVNLTASPIALIESHIKRIMTTSSNTSIPPISRFNWNDKRF